MHLRRCLECLAHLKFLVAENGDAEAGRLAGAGRRPFLCDRSPSTASGAPARPEGAPDSGGAARVGEGAARRGTADRGARPLLRSWRAPPLCYWSGRGRPAGARSQLRREPSSGSASPLLLEGTASLLLERPRPAGGGAIPAPARAQLRQVRPSPSLISN
jgi:hypothetical protein